MNVIIAFSKSYKYCKPCGSFELASHTVVRRNKDKKMQVSHCEFTDILALRTKCYFQKLLRNNGIEVSKLLCFVDFLISSFSLNDKAGVLPCPLVKNSYVRHFKGTHGKLYIVGKLNKICRFREKM